MTAPGDVPEMLFSLRAPWGPGAILGAKGTEGNGVEALASHPIVGKRRETGQRRGVSGCEKGEPAGWADGGRPAEAFPRRWCRVWSRCRGSSPAGSCVGKHLFVCPVPPPSPLIQRMNAGVRVTFSFLRSNLDMRKLVSAVRLES